MINISYDDGRLLAEVLADNALENGDARVAQMALDVIAQMRDADQRPGAAALIESSLLVLAESTRP